MTIFGITGHTRLTKDTEAMVHRELDEFLNQHAGDDLVGVSCLARGADQIFADVLLTHAGQLEVIAPSKDYFDAITDPASRARCDDLLSRAANISTLAYPNAGADAYLAASRELVDRCQTLIAVWDGSPSGTADAVAYARQRGRDVIVIWPAGSARG